MSTEALPKILVRCADGRRRFIDLYFPQVAIGVECDEGYHRGNAQRRRDEQRTVELIDAIRQIDESSYTQLRVDVSGKTLEEVDARVGEVAGAIRAAADERRRAGTFREWRPDTPVEELLAGREVLRVSDDIGFPTIARACNAVLGCSYKGMQRAYFRPAGLRARGIGTYAWFPKLSVDGQRAEAGNWINTLSSDGRRIFEANADDAALAGGGDRERRVVFAQTLDRVTGERLYRFVGQFELEGLGKNALGKKCEVYARVSDEWPIVR